VDLLPGFAWPLPRAFASAVSVCRFEQGDLLYDAPGAYEAWKRGRAKRLGCRVQVLDPPRTARTAPAETEGSRFAANWASPMTLELADGSGARPRTVRCTQGRLFTCVWRGAPELLVDVEPGGASDPPLPLGSRELQKQLEIAVPALEDALRGDPPRVLFASVVDESSEASLAKARGIEAALTRRYALEVVSLSPGEAQVPDGEAYHPALRLRGSAVPEADPKAVRELLKRALYSPTRSGADSSADRFKLERHGLLVSPEPGLGSLGQAPGSGVRSGR
jgi:hypothetical protein